MVNKEIKIIGYKRAAYLIMAQTLIKVLNSKCTFLIALYTAVWGAIFFT